MDDKKKFDFLIDAELKSAVAKADKSNTADDFSGLAKAYNVRGMFSQALEAAENATELDNSHFFGWFENALAATTVGEPALRTILDRLEALVQNGGEYLGKIKTAKALTHYYLAEDTRAKNLAEEVIASGQDGTHIYEVLGYIAYDEEDTKTALRHFLKAIEEDEDNFRAHWMIGHCWFEFDDLDAALESYHRALELQPYFANAWFSIGKVYLVMEEVQTAYQCFNKCLSINPRMWDCYFTQSDYYLGHKAYRRAISYCLRILELDPDKIIVAEANNYIGEVLLVEGDFDAAHDYFQEAIRVESNNAVYFNNLGVTMMKQGNVDESIELFRKSSDLDPTFAYPVTKMGQAYLNKKDYDTATDMFEKALRIDEHEYWAWLGLSEVYRKKRKFRNQLEAVLKAAEICSDDSDVYNYMGIAFQSLKDFENAEKAYLRSLDLDPLNRKAANNLGFLYEKYLEKTSEPEYRDKAVAAWKQRLLICRDTGVSTGGAVKHLNKLGIDDAEIEVWLEEEENIKDML